MLLNNVVHKLTPKLAKNIEDENIICDFSPDNPFFLY